VYLLIVEFKQICDIAVDSKASYSLVERNPARPP
jgi:hypothetical protein